MQMQRSDGSNFTTRDRVHIEGRLTPWLLMERASLCLGDIQKTHGQMRFPSFTFLIQVCTFCQFIWTAFQVENTEHIKYPDPEPNAVNPNKTTIQLAQKLSTGPPTQEQPQYTTSSSSEPHGASHLQSAATAVSGSSVSLQITHERNPGPNGQPLELTGMNSKPRHIPANDVSEGSMEYHAKFVAPHSSSESEVARLEVERQLSVSLAVQTEPDHRIAQLSDELALKSALLEQAQANSAEAANRAASPLEQRDAGLVDMQAKLHKLVVSHDQQVRQYEKEFANMRAKLEAMESELEAVRLQLTDPEGGWTKSTPKADKLRRVTAGSLIDSNEERGVCELKEIMQVTDAGFAPQWNEKSIETTECRNEGLSGG